MADFKISTGTAKIKTWKAEGGNPLTWRKMTIHGRQKDVPDGNNNLESEQTFDARH